MGTLRQVVRYFDYDCARVSPSRKPGDELTNGLRGAAPIPESTGLRLTGVSVYGLRAISTARMGAGSPSMVLLWSCGSRKSGSD